MKYSSILLSIICSLSLISCQSPLKSSEVDSKDTFSWKSANIYFLLTDRFNAAESDTTRVGADKETAVLRGFEGGNIKGVTNKIKEGYFQKLGVDAIWTTPVVRQIDDATDEGTGVTYGYHGYWTKDWTSIEPSFGTHQELKEFVETAHEAGIKVVMDAVLNHTGPVTDLDPTFPEQWVRDTPPCDFKNYQGTVECTLVANLPDIKTESGEEVELPQTLLDFWESENRMEQEIAELDAFFNKTGLKKTPRNYVIKWLTDYVRELGIDGFRVDTTKHVDEDSWVVLKQEAERAFEEYHQNNNSVPSAPFYMVGEVYFYGISGGPEYDFGDKKVNYFDYGFDALINFDFKADAANHYEFVFNKYDSLLNKTHKNISVLSYISSHDDSQPFDIEREEPIKSANMLLLAPGGVQMYYGDEIARPLVMEGAEGDANLRSVMNWSSIEEPETKEILTHWQKLGQFRKSHPAIGLGEHKMLQIEPYFFSRSYEGDTAIVGLDLIQDKEITIQLPTPWSNVEKWYDSYSNQSISAQNGTLHIKTDQSTVLLSPEFP
ncbi:MAG: alpha-amylase [Flavobacteriaceae bacterium]|nr:alpha-amylase [Flavobacteriaceae bacterium]